MNNNEQDNNSVSFNGTAEYAQEPNENVLLGIIGALLFGIVGAIPWVIVAKLGYVAGICGAIIIIASMKGYQLFAKTFSLKGMIICIVLSILLLFGAECVAIALEVQKVFGTSFINSLTGIPDLLGMSTEFKMAFIKDVVVGVLLTIICSLSFFKGKLRR